MYKISPSLLGSLLECPRCLWLHYNEEIERPRGIFPSLPGGMDGVIKKYFDSFREKGTLPPEIDSKVDGVLFREVEKLNVWRNNWKGLTAEFPKLDMRLKGAIDELLLNSKQQLVPFDFKTRGYPVKEDTHEHYQIQVDLYGLLFQENGYEPADYGYLLFFYPESYSGNQAKFVTELVKMEVSPKRGLQYLKGAYKTITSDLPAQRKECGYCSYAQTFLNLTNDYEIVR